MHYQTFLASLHNVSSSTERTHETRMYTDCHYNRQGQTAAAVLSKMNDTRKLGSMAHKICRIWACHDHATSPKFQKGPPPKNNTPNAILFYFPCMMSNFVFWACFFLNRQPNYVYLLKPWATVLLITGTLTGQFSGSNSTGPGDPGPRLNCRDKETNSAW